MTTFPEMTFEFEGKTIKSIDYGWEKKDFIAIDKITGIKYLFQGAYLSDITPCLKNDIVETVPVIFE